ncbi:MAG: hypothetical protein VZR06_11835 [Butyrivibrio sp.]|nr:hypothetical protein [Butyrivibrio sp.]
MKQINLVNGETYSYEGVKYFVTCTDKFMSGWGLASGKIAKRVIICDNRQQALIMIDRLQRPKCGMKNVGYLIREKAPYYTPSKYVVSFDVYSETLFNY